MKTRANQLLGHTTSGKIQIAIDWINEIEQEWIDNENDILKETGNNRIISDAGDYIDYKIEIGDFVLIDNNSEEGKEYWGDRKNKPSVYVL